ncbi:MAG TPA: DUF1294 domain-containing protein [Herpetosiphonaceae bacterium]
MPRRAAGGPRLPYETLAVAALVGALCGLAGNLAGLGRVAGAWIALISLVAFIAFVWDKAAARRAAGRTSERGLLWLVAAGGTLGAGLAMLLVRHKTAKSAFLRPFWLIVGLQVAGLLLARALA